MASIRKRGKTVILLVVSRGYDYQGNRLKPAQKDSASAEGADGKTDGEMAQ